MNRKKILLGIGVILLISMLSFLVWASFPLGPLPEAEDALVSNTQVTVIIDEFISFIPISSEPTKGLIFYPGGRVAEESYAPLAQMIASHGYLVVIVPMPLHLAVFSPNKAMNVIETFSSISTWAIAGHSLGGSIAAAFIDKNPDLINGLYLLASYPADGNDLSNIDIEVLSIYGTNDYILSTPIEDTLSLLPSSTKVIVINGGNHAYFGYYGSQAGDGEATITREDQHNITTTAIVRSLTTL